MSTLLAVLISLAALVFLFELGFQLRGRSKLVKRRNVLNFAAAGMLMYDPKVGFRLRPGSSTSDLEDWERRKAEYDDAYHGLGFVNTVNPAGYRGKLYPAAKANGALRVLVLGDSTTWGTFNHDGETWPDQLERILEQMARRPVEVVNLAVGAYTSKHALELYRRYFGRYDVDVLLVSCWWNDMYYRGRPRNGRPDPTTDYDVCERRNVFPAGILAHADSLWSPRQILRDVFRLEAAGFVASKIHRNVATPTSDLVDYNEEFFRSFYGEHKVWFQNYLAHVREMISLAEARNPRVEKYIVEMPTFIFPDGRANYRSVDEFPRETCEMYHRSYAGDDEDVRLYFAAYYYHARYFGETLAPYREGAGFRQIRGHDTFRDVELQDRNSYFRDEMHLNAAGHRRFAELVANTILATHGGGVVYRGEGPAREYLVVQSSKNPDHWVFPKGHIKRGETTEATAVREVREEAGAIGRVLTTLGVLAFDAGGEAVRAEYFLMSHAQSVAAEERRETRWCRFDEAMKLVSFDGARDLLRRAKIYGG